ncbi:hypothetical protein GRF29_154g885071 [Pseudopithomyces chartarum]|uniref:Zn(2)-C6 fungal-type domain-containing protein n=1 Tax=Pseudopithomyces chartarum TaxID=1892770 RepID=A0AAN6LRP6_9PLEO|nr:hypothetical protein GRF29_154g885071 [Pseudopithomyces chartarum]
MAGAIALAMQATQQAHISDQQQQQQQEHHGHHQSEVIVGDTPPAQGKPKSGKSTRTRTGCLTCRDRHLKCDEGSPSCQNCLKSNRECRKGMRINWIDTQVKAPPHLIPPADNWTVEFKDESRKTASEYVGGIEMYPARPPAQSTSLTTFEPPTYQTAYAHHHRISNYTDITSEYSSQSGYAPMRSFQNQQQHQLAHSTPSDTMSAQASVNAFMTPNPDEHHLSRTDAREMHQLEGPDFLVDQEEVLFMQVFVEEVGIWMDSMDAKKHFSRQLPFHALKEPMLLNAFLASGARHLALVNKRYSQDRALKYYDKATKHLLDALQDPNRDTILCATTAVILNVYEIMGERALQRMNHIAGARALIKECGWNARSSGIGAACFWLNVGMELLSCLHFNWQVAWDPDEWGIDMNMEPETESGREEFWTYRIVYIVAKVCNFRASIPRDEEAAKQSAQARYVKWIGLTELADRWNTCIPRTMHPMAYLYPGQTLSGSCFPEVWLIKRASIVARLFYHTCMCLLAQINPLQNSDSPEMHQMLNEHSQLICGISAHVKDRGVASVALRSLAIAAECLDRRDAQEEVLTIVDKIRTETGWRVGFINDELKQKWGWNNQQEHQPVQAPPQAPAQLQPQPRIYPMMNPLAGVDFNNAQHPYQEHYIPPNVNIMQQQDLLQTQSGATPQHQQTSNNAYPYY